MEKKRKILLVDDSDLISDMVSNCLESEGYQVVRARNGVEGIEKTYQEVPDLIIMDVEMPLLQGYQASRILKSRRGVRDIPIIMHTSLSEDRDRYWAYSSGAEEFISKDMENLEQLSQKVHELVQHQSLDLDIVREDAKKINRESIFELLGNLFDRELFQSTIHNQVGEVSRHIGSVTSTVRSILDLLKNVCEPHISVLILGYSGKPVAYLNPSKEMFERDTEDFLEVCLNDFFQCFPALTGSTLQKVVFGVSGRKDYKNVRLGKRRISSYSFFRLRGKGDGVIGTLHLGNFHNNYFSEHINDRVELFTRGAGLIIENSVLFNRIAEMEKKLRNVFSKFVPSQIIDDLVEQQSTELLHLGEKRNVAILFSDIRSFTTISEANTPEDIVAFLNRYFEVMGSVIRKYGGTIDKFIGDAILAIFGAPKSYRDNAARVLRAAAEMVVSLKQIHTGNLKLPKGILDIGVGIHEGPVIVGNIGSNDKFDYTVIGDTVNLASRLEGLTKHYQKRIIVSQAVKEKAGEEFTFMEIDKVRVKGKGVATEIYSLAVGDEERLDEKDMKVYKKALNMYRMKNWMTSLEYFKKLLERHPEEKIYLIYAERCRKYLKDPPPNDWNGSIALDFK